VSHVFSGLDVAVNDPSIVGDRSWALLANHAAVTRDLEPARIPLVTSLPGELRLLFTPEHGLDGIAQDMEAIEDLHDPLTGAPVRSLYGADTASLRPDPEDLESIEVVVADLPDIGTRYYTFAASLDGMMAACVEVGVEVVVLDRPNPMGGTVREGGPVEPGNESFVSALPTPIRHGLTLGELALLLRRVRYPDLSLTVVLCEGWRRPQWLDETGLPWVAPSPNMPTIDTVGIYPGMCLIEATTLSEGRGTTRPFHLVGAPGVDGRALVSRVRKLDLPGVAFRQARFRPMFGKHAGRECSGLEIHVTDRDLMSPVAMGLHLLKAFHDHDPDAFGWRTEPYEFVADVPALDLLTGSSLAREAIQSGEALEPLLDRWRAYVSDFEDTLDGILLYHQL
jgi:uncharacterized protein YbbC (DUF1343 family)